MSMVKVQQFQSLILYKLKGEAMARLVSLGFVMCDMMVTVLSALSGMSSIAFVTMTLVSSFTVSLLSKSVRSVFWPSYFWDQPTELIIRR